MITTRTHRLPRGSRLSNAGIRRRRPPPQHRRPPPRPPPRRLEPDALPRAGGLWEDPLRGPRAPPLGAEGRERAAHGAGRRLLAAVVGEQALLVEPADEADARDDLADRAAGEVRR